MISPEHVAEQNMAAFWDLRESGQLSEALNGLASLGYDSFGVEFALNPDSYYFPNLRGTQLIRPRDVGEDKIAICALTKAVMYTYEGPTLHHMQHSALSRSGLTSLQFNDVVRYFKNAPRTIERNGAGTALASVYSAVSPTTFDADSNVLSKPMIIFNAEPDNTHPMQSDPSVVLHEMVHVVQNIASPLRPNQERLKRELEAYYVQSKMADVYGAPLTESTRTAYKVEEFRSGYLQPNDFDPDPEFRAKFTQHPQFQRVVRGLL